MPRNAIRKYILAVCELLNLIRNYYRSVRETQWPSSEETRERRHPLGSRVTSVLKAQNSSMIKLKNPLRSKSHPWPTTPFSWQIKNVLLFLGIMRKGGLALSRSKPSDSHGVPHPVTLERRAQYKSKRSSPARKSKYPSG